MVFCFILGQIRTCEYMTDEGWMCGRIAREKANRANPQRRTLPHPDRRRLRASDEYRARYGTGMDIATRAAYDSPDTSALKKIFGDWGLWENRQTDWAISAWGGQGIYRDLKAKCLDQGQSEPDADRRALLLRERPRMGQLIPAEGAIRFAGNLALPISDIATWDEKHFRADILRALKSTVITRLPTVLYENHILDD